MAKTAKPEDPQEIGVVQAETASRNEVESNDPTRRHPSDPTFTGQGLDMSVYGAIASDEG